MESVSCNRERRYQLSDEITAAEKALTNAVGELSGLGVNLVDETGQPTSSYGGQLTAWLITQTHIFKAAIPSRAIINLVSYNYMTYYNQYEEMEFGMRPHQADVMDELWKRSALRYVAQVKTPTLLIHGENDNDVPIAESEQFYIGLKDVGVETAMLRYPREGHGLREPKHVVDSIDRSIAWYEKYFPRR